MVVDDIKVVLLKESVLQNNDEDADRLRKELIRQGTCLVNLMSAPGSGKTSTLLALNQYLKDQVKWGVMEADIDSDVDARTLREAGIASVQLHTGGMCHLDADMTRQGVKAMEEMPLDLVVLENIGNLVCPAEFDTGAFLNMSVLSVPEGDDKPAKYPLMYEKSDILVINKIDTLAVFDFDKDLLEKHVRECNPKISIFYISAKTGEGVQELAEYLSEFVKGWKDTWVK